MHKLPDAVAYVLSVPQGTTVPMMGMWRYMAGGRMVFNIILGVKGVHTCVVQLCLVITCKVLKGLHSVGC